jgi:hypothetical protein
MPCAADAVNAMPHVRHCVENVMRPLAVLCDSIKPTEWVLNGWQRHQASAILQQPPRLVQQLAKPAWGPSGESPAGGPSR